MKKRAKLRDYFYDLWDIKDKKYSWWIWKYWNELVTKILVTLNTNNLIYPLT